MIQFFKDLFHKKEPPLGVPIPPVQPPTMKPQAVREFQKEDGIPKRRLKKYGKRLPDSLIASSHALLREKTIIEIAKNLGTSAPTLYRRYQKLGLAVGHAGTTGIPREKYKEIHQKAIDEGLTLQQCGDILGVTRERVRQVFKELGDLPRQIARKQSRAVVRTTKLEAAYRDVKCVICEDTFPYRGTRRDKATCGPRCARLYILARLRLFPDQYEIHRQRIANYHQSMRADTIKRSPKPRIDRGTWFEGSATRRAELEVYKLREETRLRNERRAQETKGEK